MAWYWIAIALGVLAPWLIMGQSIRIAFEERGAVGGLGTWFGACVLTVPILLFLSWIGTLIF
ncbi:MAG: hypothetical protein FJX62_15395 [Alphaproteobacteria bacterium]|nr:hypothetical protein [Alphaproteobacteria bacterium]